MESKMRIEHELKLKELGVYDQYLTNLKNENKDEEKLKHRIIHLRKYIKFSDLICVSFAWFETKEGYDFWFEIANK